MMPCDLAGQLRSLYDGKDALRVTPTINSYVSRSTVLFPLACVAGATAVLQSSAVWLTIHGTSTLSVTGLVAGVFSGLLLAGYVCWLSGSAALLSGQRRRGLLTLSGLTIFGAWFAPELLQVTLDAGFATFSADSLTGQILCLVFPLSVVAVLTCLALLPVIAAARDHQRDWLDSLLLMLLASPLLCIHVFQNLPMAVVVTLTTTISAVIRLMAAPSSRRVAKTEVLPVGSQSLLMNWASIVQLSGCGLLSVVTVRAFSMLMPPGLPQLLIAVGLSAAGMLLLRRMTSWSSMLSLVACGVALVFLAGLPVMFSALTAMNLQLSGGVTAVPLVMGLRCAQNAVWMVAAFAPWLANSGRPGRHSLGVWHLPGLFVGVLAGLLLTGVTSWSNALTAGLVLQCLTLSPLLLQGDWQQTRLGQVRVSLAGLSFAVLLLLVSVFRPDSAGSSRLLFSERTQMAQQRGLESELIAQSDASRLLETVATSEGELTIWRRLGQVAEFRLQGVTQGQVSARTEITPQPAEDILPAILGLANHPQPGRVLVLGDETGAILRTVTHFPVQEIVGIRSSTAGTARAAFYNWQHDAFPANEDNRVTLRHGPAELLVRDRSLALFDVVLSAPAPASATASAGVWSVEFYRAVRARMASQAVFCQRYRRSDLGPQPLEAALATLASVFRHAGAIQTVPGEVVLLASDAESGLILPELLSRLQREHVLRELAGAGWDWSQISVLPLVSTGDRLGMFSTRPMPQATTAARAQILFQQPWEAARGGNKAAELAEVFGPHQMQIASAIPVGEGHEEAKRRLSGLAQQLEILAGMPDQPWTYRKSLRMEMQRSPRPPMEVIENGKIVREAHPLDKARQDYFLSLGSALMAASQNASDALSRVQQLSRFASTGEPLMGHFAHYEIVRLHEMLNHPAPAEELVHRLHTVFFTTPTDASVRPVIAAMEQLVESPELIPDEAERFDQLNSLVQKLIERWEARTAWEPRSAVRVQQDVDQSVRVTNLALEQMALLCRSAALSDAEFRNRRRFVNAALINPLRQYRDQVLAHRMKTTQPAPDDNEVPNDLPLLVTPPSPVTTN